jgi:Family of unknown function (DUF5681)
MSKFTKNESGNPLGRPKGIPDKRTTLLREFENDLPALLNKLKELAMDGDVAALKLMLDKLLPTHRPTHERISLPEFSEALGLTDKVNLLLNAIADATLPPDVGIQLISAIGTAARVEEISQLKERLEAVEVALKARAKK